MMLTVTFCKVDVRDIRFRRSDILLPTTQLVFALALYTLLRPLGPAYCEGVFICIFCPTATAAPVVTGLLDGDVARVTSLSLLSNIVVALTAPLFFSCISPTHITFLESLLHISKTVAPLILVPIATALVLERTAPRVHATLKQHQSLSFYLWAIALFVIVSNAVNRILENPDMNVTMLLTIALASLATCIGLFAIGHVIGLKTRQTVAWTQGLGQKNTILAIWMANNWLSPAASIAPACYIIWQNIIMSRQIYHHTTVTLKVKKGC
jgi:BASS family bile acid:Na+ symporter